MNGGGRGRLCLGLLACIAFGKDGSLHLVRDLKLSLPGEVDEVSISPVEERIAVCVRGSDSSDLVVLDRDNPMDLAGIVSGVGRIPCASPLQWSPDGAVLVIGGNPIRLLDFEARRSCEIAIPYGEGRPAILGFAVVGGFVDSTHFLIAMAYNQGLLHGRFRDTRLSLHDKKCSESTVQIIKGRVSQGDASPVSGVAAMSRLEDPVLLWNTKAGEQKELDRRDKARFADRGQILCLSSAGGKPEIRCVFADGGKRTTFGPRAIRYFSTASNAGVLLALEYNYSYNPFSESERSSPRRWILWDIRKEQTIATLEAPIRQPKTIYYNGRAVPRAVSPYSGAISPSGRHLVLGGDDRILVYEVSR